MMTIKIFFGLPREIDKSEHLIWDWSGCVMTILCRTGEKMCLGGLL